MLPITQDWLTGPCCGADPGPWYFARWLTGGPAEQNEATFSVISSTWASAATTKQPWDVMCCCVAAAAAAVVKVHRLWSFHTLSGKAPLAAVNDGAAESENEFTHGYKTSSVKWDSFEWYFTCVHTEIIQKLSRSPEVLNNKGPLSLLLKSSTYIHGPPWTISADTDPAEFPISNQNIHFLNEVL